MRSAQPDTTLHKNFIGGASINPYLFFLGGMFFKLKTNADQNKFMTRSNVAITPLKYTHEKIEKDDDITVELQVGGWYMKDTEKDEHKYGLSFTVKEVWWGGEPVKVAAPKKRKAESVVADSDDEVRIVIFCTYII